MKKVLFGLLMLIVCTGVSRQARAETYYIAPNGDDNRSGTSKGDAWATFNHAWQFLFPGDTLILLDGIYYQTLQPNVRAGQPGKPITIKAQNDGQAIIDGEFTRDVIRIGDWTPRDWFVIEGLVARNALLHVIHIDKGTHNVLRRISAYNASVDDNSAVIAVQYPEAQYNLIEDCVAAGTGRKMIYTYGGQHNTFRRCFAAWLRWDGRKFCEQQWPNGSNLQFYGGSYNLIENGIAFGGVPKWNVSMGNQGNLADPTVQGNQILGTISLLAGRDWTGQPMNYGTRPACDDPTKTPVFANLEEWPYFRIGFVADRQDNTTVSDNVFRDIFSYGNYSEGMGYYASAFTSPGGGFIIDHATITGNLGLAHIEGPSVNIGQQSMPRFDGITNSLIGGTQYQEEGARLLNRYVDGVLTNEPLWPWPMEERIQRELGLSVTGVVQPLVTSQGQTAPVLPASMPASVPLDAAPAVTPTPTSTVPTPTATPIPTQPTGGDSVKLYLPNVTRN